MITWTRRRECVDRSGLEQCVYYSNNTGDFRYRAFGGWVDNIGYRYRAEYRTETGWWPCGLGPSQYLRDVKLAAWRHYEQAIADDAVARND